MTVKFFPQLLFVIATILIGWQDSEVTKPPHYSSPFPNSHPQEPPNLHPHMEYFPCGILLCTQHIFTPIANYLSNYIFNLWLLGIFFIEQRYLVTVSMQNLFSMGAFKDSHSISSIFVPLKFATSCISVENSIHIWKRFSPSLVQHFLRTCTFVMEHVASTNFKATIFKAACFLSHWGIPVSSRDDLS